MLAVDHASAGGTWETDTQAVLRAEAVRASFAVWHYELGVAMLPNPHRLGGLEYSATGRTVLALSPGSIYPLINHGG